MVEAVGSIRTVRQGAYLLRRAETSYHQLTVYKQLASDILEYIVIFLPPKEEKSHREVVVRDLAELNDLINYEVRLVNGNGDTDDEFAEKSRLAGINEDTERLLAASRNSRLGAEVDAPTFSIYSNALKPRLLEAIDGEQKEIASVEDEMRALQAHMQRLGWAGLLVQVAIVGLFLLIVTRTALDPLARLVVDIKQIGRDRLGHRALVTRHDEFGLLATHINRMASNLERNRRSLVAANSELEATVRERTRTLQQRNEDLIEIDASRRRFFADVSHDLRTPLTAIVGEADVTLRIPDVCIEGHRQALSSIHANATYLNRRIDDLMVVARTIDGKFELDCEIVDLNLIAAGAIGAVGTLAAVNRVTPRFDAPLTPTFVHGDAARLRQCVSILLDNAVKLSRADQTIDITVRSHGAFVDLTVTDNGLGIPVIESPMVFERYNQTGVGRRRGGTGLGLSIARRIVEAHSGTMTADRSEHGGTLITMTFNLSEQAEVEA